ncbi:MAG TPA: hypothetical protein VI485_09745 [Vicinamibacterales bacterium]|nr:hypothetical protein [Vicinamibacterales bacterium]
MSNEDKGPGSLDLQFDRLVTDSPSSVVPSSPAAVCAACQSLIATEYYQVNGTTVCERCRLAIESHAETPAGIAPLVKAGAFGLGAGLVGAAIYYAVIAIANLEIGIVAILIGYMVGYSVRKGAGGRGGRRFQILAVALTYASVAFAYTPLAIQQAIEANRKDAKSAAAPANNAGQPAVVQEDAGDSEAEPGSRGLLLAGAVMLGLIAALPVLVVFGGLPMSLISGAIIFFGMRQAWVMTATPQLQIYGPYRVGAEPTPTST